MTLDVASIQGLIVPALVGLLAVGALFWRVKAAEARIQQLEEWRQSQQTGLADIRAEIKVLLERIDNLIDRIDREKGT